MKKKKIRCEHSSAFIFEWILFILVGNKDNHIEAWRSLNFCQIEQLTTELAAFEGLKINVSTFSRLLLI